jgi:hypothetical protein
MGRTDNRESAPSLASTTRRVLLRGPQDVQEARLRDAVGRLQVLLLRDLVAQYEADELNPDMRSDHRGWLDEDVLLSRALGIYGPGAVVSSAERSLVSSVLDDLRFQGYVDRLDLGGASRRAWRLRRQNEEIVDAAVRFVDDHRWVPPVVDVSGVRQALSAIAERERPKELKPPLDESGPTAD